MESGIYQDETSGLSPEVIISEHQSSKKYLLSMLLDSPLQSHQFLLPRRHSNVIDETAVLNNGNSQLPHIATEMPSGSETSASELMQLLSQAAYMDSLVKESPKANHEHFDVITPVVEPHIQSHREGKNSAGGEFFPKKGLVMGPRCIQGQAAYISLVKESSKANLEHFDVITPVVEPHIQSHREGKNSAGGEFFPQKGLVMGPQCVQGQAAYISLVKESSKANLEYFDVITPVVEPHIQSHREGKHSAGGEFFPKKGLVMGPRCDCKLSKTSKKFHCNDVSEDDRSAMFTTFWKKMDYNQRKKFISSLVKCSFPQKRRKLTMGLARKEFAFQYHLMKNAKLLRVCKVMFLSTFNLGEFAVREWVLNKISDVGT